MRVSRGEHQERRRALSGPAVRELLPWLPTLLGVCALIALLIIAANRFTSSPEVRAVPNDRARTTLLPPHVFLGSAVRTETVPDDVRAWLDADDRPVVYVSFGSFLSARDDVLATVLTALRSLDVRVAVATGSARDLPAPGKDWLVRDFLPQTALLARAALAVTHGGNNSVTEALTFGVPMLVLPFSTDQFAGAAAIERGGAGVALDPNAASAADVIDAVRDVLAGTAPEVAAKLGVQLRTTPGAVSARRALC
jgi:zeaxanthin glucosyltransferase